SSADPTGGFYFYKALLLAVSFPFTLPHHWLDDDLSREGFFSRYPYPNHYPGYLWQGHSTATEYDDSSPIRRWSLRLALEDGNDFRGLNRLGVRAAFDTTSRFGLQSNWNYL